MNQRHMSNEPLDPVRGSRLRSVQGIIQAVEFLHPGPNDNSVLLLLIIAAKGQSRMVTFKWTAGIELDTVLPF